VQSKTKGRILIAALVLSSGFLGGVLGAYLGRSQFEIIMFAALFGFVAYMLLVSLVVFVMFTALKTLQRMNDE
jgi:hypothetical protein